jgi:hypothetical protein
MLQSDVGCFAGLSEPFEGVSADDEATGEIFRGVVAEFDDRTCPECTIDRSISIARNSYLRDDQATGGPVRSRRPRCLQERFFAGRCRSIPTLSDRPARLSASAKPESDGSSQFSASGSNCPFSTPPARTIVSQKQSLVPNRELIESRVSAEIRSSIDSMERLLRNFVGVIRRPSYTLRANSSYSRVGRSILLI